MMIFMVLNKQTNLDSFQLHTDSQIIYEINLTPA